MLNPIHDQIKAKCRQLLTSGDFDGARKKYRAMINAGTKVLTSMLRTLRCYEKAVIMKERSATCLATTR